MKNQNEYNVGVISVYLLQVSLALLKETKILPQNINFFMEKFKSSEIYDFTLYSSVVP